MLILWFMMVWPMILWSMALWVFLRGHEFQSDQLDWVWWVKIKALLEQQSPLTTLEEKLHCELHQILLLASLISRI
jgi:hypothetical protein